MNDNKIQEEAVTILQQLGLKEYEAKCFVGLSRLPSGTAKELSEITDVPRTRVYDAIRVLEAQGLVEVQHSSPQRFRAVPLEEATETLRDHFDSRIGVLNEAIRSLDQAQINEDSKVHEVWGLSGSEAIANRTKQLIDEANEEVVLVIGDEQFLTEDLVNHLNGLSRDVSVIVGAPTDSIREQIRDVVPSAEVFTSGLEWLHNEIEPPQRTEIGWLLLVDRGTILVSSFEPTNGTERAIFGRGFKNGLVVIARRLMATGLLSADDPGNP